MTLSREEAMAAIALFDGDVANVPHGDGRVVGFVVPNDPDWFIEQTLKVATLLTLARAGAEWMFASDETVARIADGMYNLADIAVSYHDCRKLARAALAALSQKE